MVGETARHAGHADIVRELIDGTIGAFRDAPYAENTDEKFWQDYLARMQGGQEPCSHPDTKRVPGEDGKVYIVCANPQCKRALREAPPV